MSKTWQCKKCKCYNDAEKTAEFKAGQFLFLTVLTFGWYLIFISLKSCMNMSQESFRDISNQHYCKNCGTRKQSLY